MNIPVIYQDDWLLVVDKPQGLLSVPDDLQKSRNLAGILNDDLEAKQAVYKLYPCHRLDRETSGLIIFAKNKLAQERMMRMFKEKSVHKQYTAFVHGVLPKPAGQISYALEGKSALTKYKVIREYGNFSVVEVTPLTGRTNQIRIHFKKIGHPLVGESKFAFRKDFALRFKRVCLHAGSLLFIHPFTGKQITLRTDLPVDMQGFLLKYA